MDHLTADVDHELQVARITFDMPEKMNRISMVARAQLRELFERFDADDSVRVIVMRGAGDKAFSAGGDIAGFMKRDQIELSHLHENVAAPSRCSKPVIAAVDGYCFGVGFELALASDFIIATRKSSFALPEATIGMIPGSGGSQRLLQFLGPFRTKWMVMRGQRISAAQALEWGIVSKVVDDGELDRAEEELIRELTALSPVVLGVAKRIINAGQDTGVSSGMLIEGLAYGLMRTTEDFAEGVEAFTNKRKPRFKGR